MLLTLWPRVRNKISSLQPRGSEKRREEEDDDERKRGACEEAKLCVCDVQTLFDALFMKRIPNRPARETLKAGDLKSGKSPSVFGSQTRSNAIRRRGSCLDAIQGRGRGQGRKRTGLIEDADDNKGKQTIEGVPSRHKEKGCFLPPLSRVLKDRGLCRHIDLRNNNTTTITISSRNKG